MSNRSGLFRSTVLVSCLTGVSRVLGLAREIIFASLFGATAGMDAFLVAFKIPNFLRRLFAEGAFSQAFVPILSEYRERESHEAFLSLIQKVSGSLALVVFLVSVLGSFTSVVWIAVFSPGFWHMSTKFYLASDMLRITFPYLFFISLTALSGAVLNTVGKFGIPAATPIVLNVVLIVGPIWAKHYFSMPIMVLPWSVLVAGILQFLIQLPFLKRLGLLKMPKIAFRDPGVRRVLRLMVPALFGASVAQLSLLLDTVFASFLKNGSVSWLYYSDRLMQFPLGVFGVAISTVILPHLSRKVAVKDQSAFESGLAFGLKWVFLIGLPASMGLMVLAHPLVETFLGYGAFNQKDILMTTESLRAFALGVVCFMAVKVLVTGFYSQQNLKTPVKVATFAMLLNGGLNLILMWPLAHVGIAISTTVSAVFNMSLLAFLLYRQGHLKITRTGVYQALKLLIATGLMGGIVGIAAHYLFGDPFTGNLFQTITARVFRLGLILMAGLLSYCGTLWVLRVPLMMPRALK